MARERDRRCERMNQRVQTTNRAEPPVFRCRRLSVSDWREVTGDPSRDAIKLVISPAARPLQPAYGEIIDHHEIIVIVISRMFIGYSTRLGSRKV